MEIQNKISVLIPVYNAEKYLRQCLDSVINQTYKNIEIVCVNDASTDTSLAILNEYAQKDKRIIVVDKIQNEGVAKARKTAIVYSSGELILYVDSDDWIELDMFEKMVARMQSDDYDLIYCDFYWYTASDKNYIHKTHLFYTGDDKIQRIKHNIFGNPRMYAIWNKLVKREIYENIVFPKAVCSDDVFISSQLFYYADRIGYVPLPFYHYRHNENSITNDDNKKLYKYKQAKSVFGDIIEFCKEKFGNNLDILEPELSKTMVNYKEFDFEHLEILKISKLPIYLYGAGELAEMLYCRFFDPRNIAIAGVIVAEKYYKTESVFYGHLIHPAEQVLNENLQANIILGYLKDNYDDDMENLKKIAPNCNFLVMQKMFLEDLQIKISSLNTDTKQGERK